MSTEQSPEPEGTSDRRTSGTLRRRRPALIAVSIAAAALLAGGGSAYWASTTSDGGGGNSAPTTDRGEPPPLELDRYGTLPAEPDGGSSGGGGGGAGPVSERDAKKAAEPILKGIGMSDAKLDASRTIGAVRIVNANPVLGTLPTYGRQTGLQIGSDGRLVAGSGHLTELTKGPDYPVLGAAETLKLLNRASGGGTVGIGGCASAVPLDGTEGADALRTMPCPPADGAQPGPVAIPVRDAVFGLAVHFVAGQQALVPSWMFEVAQPGTEGKHSTFTVTYPAVQEKHIARSSPGTTRMHIESYRTDDRTLTLDFWGGVCSDYSASADISAPGTVKVEVTGKEREPGQVCIMIAKRFEEKVTLAKPLGDRTVVDAATGKPVPKKN